MMNWFAKMIFDGGGSKYLKKPAKSKHYLSKFLNISKYFFQLFLEKVKNIYKKLTFAAYDIMGGVDARDTHRSRFFNLLSSFQKTCTNHKFHLLNSKGSILIEFAVCMPVLIILLFYINDLSKLKRYYDQTEFVAQQMVNILQNISQKRTDKKIRADDIKRAVSLACLSMYPGKTVYSIMNKSPRHELSHYAYVVLYCIKGLSDGKASVKWKRRLYPLYSPADWSFGNFTASVGVVRNVTNAEPSAIYPTLRIDKDELKIIVEVHLVNESTIMNPNKYVPTDNKTTQAKKAFGCLLISPKSHYNSNDQGRYFSSVVIFTPKPGLFDESSAPS